MSDNKNEQLKKTEQPKKKFSAKDMGNYFKEVKSDMKKIVWPSSKAVVKNSLIVIVAIIISSGIISLVDFGFESLADFLVNL